MQVKCQREYLHELSRCENVSNIFYVYISLLKMKVILDGLIFEGVDCRVIPCDIGCHDLAPDPLALTS
jgi:hypothetical protein